jgi:hypothetical protein
MKYPERLSPERLFFLSKEERAIYESEWANFSTELSNDVTESDSNDEYVNVHVWLHVHALLCCFSDAFPTL